MHDQHPCIRLAQCESKLSPAMKQNQQGQCGESPTVGYHSWSCPSSNECLTVLFLPVPLRGMKFPCLGLPLDHLCLTFKAPLRLRCLHRQTIEIPYLSHCLPRRSTPRHKRTLFLVVSRVVPVPVQLRLSLPGWLLYNHTRRSLLCCAGLTRTDAQTQRNEQTHIHVY